MTSVAELLKPIRAKVASMGKDKADGKVPNRYQRRQQRRNWTTDERRANAKAEQAMGMVYKHRDGKVKQRKQDKTRRRNLRKRSGGRARR